MINGLGVLGWGVGGIEAEAVMLGQPIYMLIPEVVGMRLTGSLPEGTTATDLVLRITEILRAHGVVGKFVEFYGSGLADMPLADRATIANMAPEYGATCGFFPIDDRNSGIPPLSGRDESLIATVESYSKAQGFWRNDEIEPDSHRRSNSTCRRSNRARGAQAAAGPIGLPRCREPGTTLTDVFGRDGADGGTQATVDGRRRRGSGAASVAVVDRPKTAVSTTKSSKCATATWWSRPSPPAPTPATRA